MGTRSSTLRPASNPDCRGKGGARSSSQTASASRICKDRFVIADAIRTNLYVGRSLVLFDELQPPELQRPVRMVFARRQPRYEVAPCRGRRVGALQAVEIDSKFVARIPSRMWQRAARAPDRPRAFARRLLGGSRTESAIAVVPRRLPHRATRARVKGSAWRPVLPETA